jgi:hypothetical protein
MSYRCCWQCRLTRTRAGWRITGARVSQIHGLSAIGKNMYKLLSYDSVSVECPRSLVARVAKSVDARDLKVS